VREYAAVPLTRERYPFGEGTRYDAATGELLWVDIAGGLLLRAPLEEVDAPAITPVGVPLGAVAPAAAGGWVLAAGRGFAHLGADGTLTPLGDVEPEGNRMNDGTCDPLGGRFWAGSQAYDERPGAASLHRLDADGHVTTVLRDLTIANGPAWSSDGRTMYLDDSGRRTLTAYDVDPASGEVSHPRVLIRFSSGTGDGVTVDDEGFLWVALFGGSAVERYDPAGRLVGRVPLPASQVTCCCLVPGGRLVVSTSSTGMRDPEPDAGRLFVADVGVGGPPVTPYAGGGAPPGR